MYKSKDINESQFLNDISVPRLSETCNGAPKITSTPLNSHVASLRRNKSILSPGIAKQGTLRRYSLSEASPSVSRSNVNAGNSPGPLLASLNFKDNVSMYEETKSSGLARRIVLYNEEAEQERHHTHQEKYNSPGLFPIVHLFKKSPPLLEQSPKRVKIKLSSPEYLRNYSPQHRNKILEGIGTKPGLQRQHSLPTYTQANETSTKSVLDALKEISRKRMHSNEEHEHTAESGKRLRTELYNGSAITSKRTRADSPLLDPSKSPSPKQTQKKFCVYDEFAASKSSSDFSFLTKLEPLRSKRKTTSTSTESLTDIKHVKLVNAETQTLYTGSGGKTKMNVLDELDNEDSNKKECLLKVFDDAPLDRIRKSRLAALMGNLAGKDAALAVKSSSKSELNNKPTEQDKVVEMPKEVERNIENTTSSQIPIEKEPKQSDEALSNKPLMSILSPSKSTKEPVLLKSDRHVQFNESTNASPLFSQTSLTQTSTSIVTPIVSDSISKSLISSTIKNVTEISFPTSSPSVDSVKSVPAPDPVPTFSFGNSASSKSETNIGSNPPTTISGNVSSFSVLKAPQISESDKSAEKLPSMFPNATEPQKSGGFRFDLKMPSNSTLTSVTKSNIPPPNFPNTALTTSTAVITSPSATFTFGNPSEGKKENSYSFATNAASVATVKGSSNPEPAVGFGGLFKSPTFNFGSSTTTSAESKSQTSITGGFSFGLAVNGPTFGNVPSSAQTSATPTFGTLPATSNNIGISLPVTTTSSSLPTGIVFGSSTSNSGQSQSKTPNFSFGGGTPSTTSASFGPKPDSIFGVNTTASIGGKTESFGNNTATNITFTSPSATSKSVFGNSSVPAFGNTQVTKPSVFGSTPTTTSSVFGSNSAGFGSSTTTNVPNFKSSIPTSAPPAFGSSQSSFGSNPTTTASRFGTTDVKSFGSSNVFGSNTPASTFGNNTFGVPAQSANLFGPPSTTSSNPPPYSSTFSTATTPASGFGSSNSAPAFNFGPSKPTSAFGLTTTTTTTSTFGTPSAFSSTGGFNSPSSGFGTGTTSFSNTTSTPSTFGVTSAPAFGQTTNKPTFAFGTTEAKTSSVFGSGAGNSAFGKPTNTQGGFGSSSADFGSSNNGFSAQQSNGGFNFGSSGSSASTPFGFGASGGNTEPSKPSFNFTGGTINSPAFGASSSTTPAFGTATLSFGGSAASFSASGPPAAGVFNIGTGSAPTGRPRTQLRAKRRT